MPTPEEQRTMEISAQDAFKAFLEQLRDASNQAERLMLALAQSAEVIESALASMDLINEEIGDEVSESVMISDIMGWTILREETMVGDNDFFLRRDGTPPSEYRLYEWLQISSDGERQQFVAPWVKSEKGDFIGYSYQWDAPGTSNYWREVQE